MSETRVPERWILTIADDLTGALEAGAKFAGQGIDAAVLSASNAATPQTPVLVIDTETRHVAESQAAAVVRRVAGGLKAHKPWLVYKKTDSTLRGNIGAELKALLEVFPERSVVYAPAYPEMGRTVRDGKLFVRGLALHETHFAADLLNPIHDSDVRAVLGGISATILDGESKEDILATAREMSRSRKPLLVAGPAGLAGALAECVPLTRKSVRALPVLSRCLVVNGSMHPASAAQIESAKAQGGLSDGWKLFEYEGKHDGLERALRTGECVQRLLITHQFDGLVVFGGDTAFGIHQALGSPPFEPYGEVLPGVPLSRCAGLFWVTKAGGFGEPGILSDIRKGLT